MDDEKFLVKQDGGFLLRYPAWLKGSFSQGLLSSSDGFCKVFTVILKKEIEFQVF